MTRVPSATTQAILDRLEPEAAACYIEEELNLPEAIAASQAMTSRDQATQNFDANVIELAQLDSTTSESLPQVIRDRYNPDEQVP